MTQLPGPTVGGRLLRRHRLPLKENYRQGETVGRILTLTRETLPLVSGLRVGPLVKVPLLVPVVVNSK